MDAIFDIHRDGIKDPAQYETTIKGEEASMVRLLVGRANQNQAENKEQYAVELKAVADKLYPELIRDIYIGKIADPGFIAQLRAAGIWHPYHR